MSRPELIAALRLEAGRSGTIEILKLLREFSVWECKVDVSPEMWREVLDVLIADASK